MIRTFACLALLAATASPLLAAGPQRELLASASKADRVFEMRTYHTLEGRLPALNKRFSEHTVGLFKKHGMEVIGFWTPVDEKDGKSNKLVYLLAYPSREAAAASWKAFQADPAWKEARDASEKDGKIVAKVDSVFLSPTDYSEIK